ncbi:hypothetical protein [uncultured Croceitalea sp.]|uniref:hypothetical protein n=1 Tax=uncultured Croceitalea sp. TaxID=1798908 RepID=UPI003306780F
MRHFFFSIVVSIVFYACKHERPIVKNRLADELNVKESILQQNKKLIAAALHKNSDLMDNVYLDSCLLLAEYQPMLDGKTKIKLYYDELFKRQDLKEYNKKTTEVFDFEKLVLEIGTFRKEFVDSTAQTGKYFNVWQKDTSGQLHLKAETFGFYKPISNPEMLQVKALTDDSTPLLGRFNKKIPMEIQAYHALGENRVRDRDTKGTVDSYTNDAVYYPFADSAKTGRKGLLKHFTAYHKNPVKIDSIETWTYDYDLVADGIIRYSKFYVKWTVPGYTGTTRGSGIAYWRRTEDNALKIHRQLGTHIHNAE